MWTTNIVRNEHIFDSLYADYFTITPVRSLCIFVIYSQQTQNICIILYKCVVFAGLLAMSSNKG